MYLVLDIPAFVMYCVYGESSSALLIESTNSMIFESGKRMMHLYIEPVNIGNCSPIRIGKKGALIFTPVPFNVSSHCQNSCCFSLRLGRKIIS